MSQTIVVTEFLWLDGVMESPQDWGAHALFRGQNKIPSQDKTSIPATFLRVTVTV